MTPAQEIYEEIVRIAQLPGAADGRYRRMYGLLRRICIAQSADFQSDYATLFSRLTAVCQAREIDHRPADRFRRRARAVVHGESVPTAEEERADVADLCHFVHQLYGESVPPGLPQHIRPLRVKAADPAPRKVLRGVVERVIDAHTFSCRIDGSDVTYRVEFYEPDNPAPEERLTTRHLYAGANVSLLDAEPQAGATDALRVYMVILEPDYLIDVSALTASLKPYGHSPLNYLLNQLAPDFANRHILLGNLANQFMDDCIHEPDAPDLYLRSSRKHFAQNVLDYACQDDKEVDAEFFEAAKLHFAHIRQAVRERFAARDVGIAPDDVLLEPSFICPALGLRGRFDVMTMDFRRILELKSGKANEWYGQLRGARQEHALQLALYREMLRRNFHFDWNGLQTFLFYSLYPAFLNERPSAAALRGVLHLRNGIVHLLHRLMQGAFDQILPLLTPEKLNTFEVSGKFFDAYLLPQLRAVTEPLQGLKHDELLHRYFSAYLPFVLRELFMSKTGDNRPDSVRGFSATWTADRRTKLLAGNLLTELRLEEVKADGQGIYALRFALPDYGDAFIPNFNKGEMVQIYEADDEEANVTNRQLIRATVAEISASELTVELAYRQRNRKLFSAEKHYAAEHDATDGPSMQQLRNLFGLLRATPARRDLLLARRAPEADPSLRLTGEYPEAVADIVLRAKQARDYFLLVGPPGTGKTNLALRSMVKEFLLDRRENRSGSLLLTAYTNRAVDEICAMLDGLTKEMELDYLRIGQPQTCAPAHRAHLLGERAAQLRNRAEARRLLDEISIVVGTVMTLTNSQILFRRKRFDCAIIDEASQLLEPQALGLLTAQVKGEEAIGKFILIGDHKQLPAVVMLPESRTRVADEALRGMGLTDLRNSLFERLHGVERRAGRTAFVGMLNRQGRMHPEICQFINRYFYEGELGAVPLPHQTESLPAAQADDDFTRFVAGTRMGFVSVKQAPHVENLRANAPEAEAVCSIVEALCSIHGEAGSKTFDPARTIGIIVPFRSQIAGIRGSLRRRGLAQADTLTIDTVECYQGSQRDYILFSTTVSEPYQLDILSSLQRVGGVSVDRKLNVAVSRARKQFFLVGDGELLSHSPIYKALIDCCTVWNGRSVFPEKRKHR